jgi:hypothetical protein
MSYLLLLLLLDLPKELGVKKSIKNQIVNSDQISNNNLLLYLLILFCLNKSDIK